MDKIKIFLSGQKYFGEQILWALHDYLPGGQVVGVSAPDRPADQKADSLWAMAAEYGIPRAAAGVTLDADRIPEGVDLIVCAYSWEYVTAAAIKKARYGAIGYHPSLLPKFKGRNSVEDFLAAFNAGTETETGGTVYQLTARFDSGPVISQKGGIVPIPGETPAELWRRKLCPLGIDMLAAAVMCLWMEGRFTPSDRALIAPAFADRDW